MEAEFWHRKWEQGDIGFHEGVVNAFLLRHFGKLALAPPSRLFLPLCGKTRDIAWLLSQGYRVAGAELSELAVGELFNELGLVPEISSVKDLRRYSAPDIDIFAGDIFHLGAAELGDVDAVYDRAALVALPAAARRRYSRHLMTVGGHAQQLLITYEYDQGLMDGPPFSVGGDEVGRLYGADYSLDALERREVAGGLKGRAAAHETVWLLRPLPNS